MHRSSLLRLVVRTRWLLPAGAALAFNGAMRLLFDLRGPVRFEIELLILVYICAVAHSFQKPGSFSAIVTTAVLLLFYGLNYAKYLYLGQPIVVSDLQEIHELLESLPASYLVLPVSLAGAVCIAACTTLQWNRWRRSALLASPLLLLICSAYFLPVPTLTAMDRLQGSLEWQKARNFYVNGSFYTIVREIAYERASLQILNASGDLGAPDLPFDDPSLLLSAVKERRNLHVLVLESFLDPMNFESLQDHDLLDPRILEWRKAGRSDSLSPVFGGETANAEFEILCGLPAMRIGGAVAFNNLVGKPVPCLPNLLRQLGYQTIAITPNASNFFNAAQAYRSIGFTDTFFENHFDMTDLDGLWLSTESTLRQALAFVSEQIGDGTPILNYVVTCAGHTPFRLDSTRRPHTIAVSLGGERMEALVNSLFYTSVAVADYVETLRGIDPAAIIIVIGDHLPPLGANFQGYREARYMGLDVGEPELELRLTPLLVFDGGVIKQIGLTAHHLIPEIAVDLLTGGSYCRQMSCMYKRAVIVRPPFFVHRSDPTRFYCTDERGGRSLECRSARALAEQLAASYRSLLVRSMESK